MEGIMENYTLARGAALFFAPMVVASCGGSSGPVPGEPPESYPALVKSAPPQVSGCTVSEDSCNETVVVGVLAKVHEDPATGEIEIRFVTVTDSGDSGIYNDGEKSVVFSLGTGPSGETIDFDPLNSNYYAVDVYGYLGNDDYYEGIVGAQTSASVVPDSGTATYNGGAFILYGDYTGYVEGDYGDSNLEVNFLTGLADLTIDLDGSITSFDQIVSTGMVIDGYTFTGDNATLLLLDADVTEDIVGLNSDGAAAGLFFGPANIDGNPEEFGAVSVVGGDDGYVYGVAQGDVELLP
jgi:hypothetical protein